MWKRIAAVIGLFILVAVAVVNFIQDKQADHEADNEQQDGVRMVSPSTSDKLKVGETAPDFTLETLSGQTVTLSELKGQKVFLNFWATWCPPCKEEMPEMEKFQQEYGDEVTVLAINGTAGEQGMERADKIENVKQFVQDGGFTFPVLLDMELSVTSEQYQVISIPTTYFIGTDGVIQKPKKVGPMTYDFMVEMKNALE
ncbi:peroxiredoxin family protein [Halobacillus salinus]|uniref:TlpA family protein disulfide reductase n=1 Tax=Halobacillus salinus TaxID=192814 RepID=A0A4Z0H2N1_9BACI|nr:TlpA disulfide reductase family protein [Halobacillus salinus]TGB04658.1 TlpA family protein disulfide reductase [Halobacillus salinus]